MKRCLWQQYNHRKRVTMNLKCTILSFLKPILVFLACVILEAYVINVRMICPIALVNIQRITARSS